MVSRQEHGVLRGMELEVSLLVVVVTLLGVLVLPTVVGVDVITWIVSVGPSIVQVYVRMYMCKVCQPIQFVYFIYVRYFTSIKC